MSTHHLCFTPSEVTVMPNDPNTDRTRSDRTRSDRTHSSRTRRRRRRRSPMHLALKAVGTVLLVLLTTSVLLACFAAVYVQSVIMPMADLDLDSFRVGINSTLYYTDSRGQAQELRTLHGDENRVWVEYKDIPKNLINATVAIEDQRYWKHPGVDWRRTAKAILLMFTGQDIQGGSTITQQLIKNVTTYDDTTVKRKVVEIFTALECTKKYNKETILEWYLNYIYLGRNCDGVYTASYKYFGKPLSELTVAECASLISITNNPSLYDPYTNPENNERRKNLVLRAMYEQDYLTKEEYEQAKAQELVFSSKAVDSPSGTDSSDVYSWYEEQVITDVTNDLAAQLGVDTGIAYNMVLSGNLSIYTCVDPKIQTIVEDIYENTDNFPWPSSNGQQLQSAITVIDNNTGDVVAMVGQVGEKTGNRWRNNATAAARQPGSSFKPLAVYAPAIELGLITPLTAVDDYPYQLLNGRPYPVNSGNAKYSGLTSVYTAVTKSTNTVAYRIINDILTPVESFKFVEDRFHIDLKDADASAPAAMSMGGLTGGVNTRDMAEAFRTFPNQGVYTPSRTYTHVVNSDGEVILENRQDSKVSVKASTAYYMNTMLRSVVTSGTGYEAKVPNMHIAGKTGSTTSDHDRWFAGYSPYYTAVVWTGYGSPERIRSSGRNPAALTFSKVMTRVHEGLPDKEFFQPNDLVYVSYCQDSGLKAVAACKSDPRGSRVAGMYVLKEDAPTKYCDCHSSQRSARVCSVSGELVGSYCPADCRLTVHPLLYERKALSGVTSGDQDATLAAIQAKSLCSVHTPGGTVTPGTSPLPDNSSVQDTVVPDLPVFDDVNDWVIDTQPEQTSP